MILYCINCYDLFYNKNNDNSYINSILRNIKKKLTWGPTKNPVGKKENARTSIRPGKSDIFLSSCSFVTCFCQVYI